MNCAAMRMTAAAAASCIQRTVTSIGPPARPPLRCAEGRQSPRSRARGPGRAPPGGSMSSVEARRATLDATEAIAEVLARAFDDDPLMNWIILDEGHRAEHLRTLFRVVSRYAYLEHDASWILEDGSGASVWRPPGIGQPDAISQIAELWPKITDTVRSGALGKLMEGRHPKEPDHYYLLAIGVDPALQGRWARIDADSHEPRHLRHRGHPGVPRELEGAEPAVLRAPRLPRDGRTHAAQWRSAALADVARASLVELAAQRTSASARAAAAKARAIEASRSSRSISGAASTSPTPASIIATNWAATSSSLPEMTRSSSSSSE